MVTTADIKWGSYKDFEGPYYYGKEKYNLPSNPDEAAQVLLVLTTTEGGTYDAYNGYDVCISTSGLIQWCDRAPYFLVCKMLGYVASKNMELLRPVLSLAQEAGYTFKKNAKHGWRFFDGTKEVTTREQQHQLYFGGASGKKGSFSPVHKEHAKRWAAAISTIWESSEAQQYQREYTLPKLFGFATSDARDIILASRQNDSKYSRAFRTAFVSFAANNPRKAGEAIKHYVDNHGMRFDRDWLVGALKAMTYHPNIAIYPHRYDKIRPVLERLYGVELPDLASELEAWSTINNFDPDVHTPMGLQRALLELGHDLGPYGADGIWGKCSKDALRTFEESQEMPKRHQDGVPDEYTVPLLREALAAKGLCFDFTA